ncbi:hypothetical protein DIZ81_09255 [Legionella taurinensis]|uniref:Effector protein A, substrate of the Dot/Icm secretion system n=1 Tax=Legionella taurinensis TaxID=70611 RepID=A0A3A5LI72_9GAMM|nr:hypothetical protein [Legionella taurinensis]MDX1837784.1 hypothetical protein [Legionella taurinensis]PUT39711.1 hypothetical protein DB744_09265 [Legionella taurinensis]PUT43404.1 hypothetical protein DB746_06585 [Legionella taurinensis]PUT45849.1 hypothetical protein DB743_06580 [Legionella taurinensis]PUT47762.1 hypothetical protein DB745_07665 [Legionella taurinensis]
MKEELRALAAQLLTSSPPTNFLSFYTLFTHYDHLFNPESSPPEEVKALWLFLHDVRDLLQRWKSNADKQAAIAAIHDEKKRNRSELQLIRDSLKSHDLEARKIKSQLEEPYQQLYEIYAKLQYQKDPILALPIYTGLREREVLITGLEETLTRELNSIKFNDLKLILNRNWLRISDIQRQLKELNITLISYNDIRLLRSELENIQGQIIGHERYLQEFTRYSQRLKESISHQELSSTLKQLSDELEASQQTLKMLDKDIEQFVLPAEVKRDLTYLFDEATDKENLLYIKGWQQVISTSSLNPLAWVNWLNNKNYAQNVQSMEHHYAYLSLLLKRNKLQSTIDSLNKKRDDAQAMLPEAPKEGQTASAPDSLNRTIVQLIQSYDASYSGQNNSSLELKQELDRLSLAASGNISLLGKGLKLVQELSELLSENTRLRTHNNIIHGNELQLSPTQIKELTEKTPARKIRIEELIRQISQCKEYLARMQQVTLSDTHTMDLNLRTIQLKRRQKELREELGRLPPPHELPLEQSQLEKELELNLKQLKALLSEQDNGKVEDPSENHPLPLKQEIEYHQKLDGMHQNILPLLQGLDQDLRHWYQNLFIALRSQANDKKHYYQAAQLLRDIHFELAYPHPTTPHAVLQAYQTLAPHPDKDCALLLKLKPAVPVMDTKPDEVKSPALKTRLDNLYAHQAGMQNKHPREAKLLEQATINLHQLAHIAEANEENDDLQNMTECLVDPRYETLQTHRGFLKIVEMLAQFITYLLRMVSPRANDHRHRFFFIPTCSSQLLQATNHELISCPA